MHAEVMAIGDELTSGERLDTNSQWLSQQLGELGIPVRFHTTVGDDLQAVTDAFRIAMQRAPVVLVTGGLGPTADDLTRDALAAASDRELQLDSEVLDHIRHMFESRGRTMPERNVVQAMFPTGCQVIANPHGTAPGIDLELQTDDFSTRLFALPGVPAEMMEMYEQTVLPRLRKQLGIDRIIVHRRVKCFGIGESHCEEMLPGLIARDRVPRVGITVHQATITLRVTATGANEAECLSQIQPTLATIRDRLGDYVFGIEDDELEHAVVRLAQQRNASLALCEWGTQGTVAQWLTRAEAPLRAGLVVNSFESVQQLLELEDRGPDDRGLVDRGLAAPRYVGELVAQMAEQLRQRTDADYCLAIGPLPDLASDNPQIHLALASRSGVERAARAFVGHPNVRLDLTAKRALDLLRQKLMQPIE